METKKVLTVAFVVFLLCVSTGSVRGYTNNNNFFSIEEPSGWTITESSSGTVVVTFYEPTTTGNDSFALIEIDVQTLTESITLEELAETVQEQYQTSFDNFQPISQSTGVVNGVAAYEITAAVNAQGLNFMLKQDIMIKNMRVYIVSYAGTAGRYQQFLPDFKDSIGTFTIIDPIPPYFWYVFIGAIIAAVAAIAAGLYIYKRRANTPYTGY